MSNFSNLELSKVHQIDVIFIAHSISDKIYLYGLKGGYDALNFLDILIIKMNPLNYKSKSTPNFKEEAKEF